jgi:hypothetical protein
MNGKEDLIQKNLFFIKNWMKILKNQEIWTKPYCPKLNQSLKSNLKIHN